MSRFADTGSIAKSHGTMECPYCGVLLPLCMHEECTGYIEEVCWGCEEKKKEHGE